MEDTGKDESPLTRLVCDKLKERIFLLRPLTLSEGGELSFAGRAGA